MKDFQTADLCDAYPDVASCTVDFKQYGLCKKFYGRIRTVSCYLDNVLLRRLVSQPGNGEVLVVDGKGARDCALMGDNIARIAMENGWAGVIIFGMIRDSVAINNMNFGIKALGLNPKKSAKKGTGNVDVTVTFGNLSFTPSHFVYSDEDGIIVSETALI
ncbi:ribonuclease E activity regulator RraA [Bisgaard Taxon 10/6]|nr:ribonuclease E activity regulator RraA [Exercitatus varius]MDG2938650.1 ribonuclease E activity regulator RraA [Exercitatus varius]